MSIYCNAFTSCHYSLWEYVYHGPSNPKPMPHISDLFKLVLRHWIIPATRRYNFRSQPRWKRGRWKSKT